LPGGVRIKGIQPHRHRLAASRGGAAPASPPPFTGEGQGGGIQQDSCVLTPSPTLPRRRERGLTEIAAPPSIRSPNRSATTERAWPSATPPSCRQQRAEAAGHGARADALGLVDQALAREPGLELRRRAALQEIAHGERVVE